MENHHEDKKALFIIEFVQYEKYGGGGWSIHATVAESIVYVEFVECASFTLGNHGLEQYLRAEGTAFDGPHEIHIVKDIDTLKKRFEDFWNKHKDYTVIVCKDVDGMRLNCWTLIIVSRVELQRKQEWSILRLFSKSKAFEKKRPRGNIF